MTVFDDIHARVPSPITDGEWTVSFCPCHEADGHGHKKSMRFKPADDVDDGVIVSCLGGCDAQSLRAGLGFNGDVSVKPTKDERTFLFYRPSQNGNGRQIVATYEYTDEAGRLLYQKVRYTPKDFVQRRPDGAGAWIYSLTKDASGKRLAKPTRTVLYRLSEVLAAAKAGELVIVNEGEKATEAVRGLGLVATCASGGAGKWSDAYGDSLKGARVAVVIDNDEDGRKHGQLVTASLRKKGIACATLEIPGLPAKGDAYDAIAEGMSQADLVNMAEHALEHAASEAPAVTGPEGYELQALDWSALLRDGVPEVEYIHAPYFPKLARIWVWGATGSYKSLYCEWVAAELSRRGVRVSYFSEENPIGEELRRLARLNPDPRFFRLFHRTGMDLDDGRWIEAMLAATQGDAITFFDSLTDLWGGDENDNRAVQVFDASVLKPLQAQGVTPVVLHHTGHKQMFSERGGATAGRGASSLGQKADLVLEFKDAGESRFTVTYAKSRLGGIRQPDRTFRVEDAENGLLTIVTASNPEEQAVAELTDKIVRLICNAPDGLTTSELRVLAGGNKERQTIALAVLESDSRIHCGVEKRLTRDGKHHDAKVWRPARDRGWVGPSTALFADDGSNPSQSPYREGVGDGLNPMSSNPSPDGGDGFGMASEKDE
jgi:hypothetical protein